MLRTVDIIQIITSLLYHALYTVPLLEPDRRTQRKGDKEGHREKEVIDKSICHPK